MWCSTVLFSLTNAAFGLAPSGFKANYLDITEEYVGVISGYGNTLGTVRHHQISQRATTPRRTHTCGAWAPS